MVAVKGKVSTLSFQVKVVKHSAKILATVTSQVNGKDKEKVIFKLTELNLNKYGLNNKLKFLWVKRTEDILEDIVKRSKTIFYDKQNGHIHGMIELFKGSTVEYFDYNDYIKEAIISLAKRLNKEESYG